MTFCIVARDPREGLLGIALATNPLSVGSRCPFIRANVGAVSSQAYTDPKLGPLALDLLELGYSPKKVMKELGESDQYFAWRQVGIVDRYGRVAVHTGANCTPGFHDAITGDGYVVMGNYLLTKEVVPAMDKAWHASAAKLFEDRLMDVALAARDAGGDLGGHRSAALQVHDVDGCARTDLRIDFAPKRDGLPDAVDALRTTLDRWKPMIPYFKVRPESPMMPGWADWLAARGTPFEA